MNNIYIPSHNADGALALILGIALTHLQTHPDKSLALVGNESFYTSYFGIEISQRIAFIDDSSSKAVDLAMKTLASIKQNVTLSTVIFANSFIDPTQFEIPRIILQDVHCLYLEEVKQLNWTVFLPPLFNVENKYIKNALEQTGVVIDKSRLEPAKCAL